MSSPEQQDGDSRPVIPGTDGRPAFTLTGPEPSATPVILAVPHAGRCYPPALLNRMRHPDHAALRLEDRMADRLAEAVARRTGAMLLVAHAPRAMIDLNRAPDDIDWEMFAGSAKGETGSYAPGRRARSGLGLIPRRLPGLGEIWKGLHHKAELSDRISAIHEPYHAALSDSLAGLHARWGAALLIDLHSMPPLPPRAGMPGAEFVVGDRFGATCQGRLVAATFASLAESRRLAVHNRPYAGDYVLQRHAAPGKGINAFQLEIDRSRYLDGRLEEPGEGFADLVTVLSKLVRRLGEEVCAMGQEAAGLARASGWAEAAE